MLRHDQRLTGCLTLKNETAIVVADDGFIYFRPSHTNVMRAVIQRVTRASVVVDGETVGAISKGLCVLIGITHDVRSSKARDCGWMGANEVAGYGRGHEVHCQQDT